MVQHLTTQQAAAAILNLINSSPHSPRPDEIEAIISRIDTIGPSAAQDPEWTARAAEYRRLRAEEAALYDLSKAAEGDEPEHERRTVAWLAFEREKILPVEREIWRNPARTVEHVVLLAEIASYHENGLLDSLEEPDPHYHDDRSAAELVVGVLALSGKKPPRLGGEE